MWTTEQLGLAVWRTNDSAWYFDARGGSFGIGMITAKQDEGQTFDNPSRYVAFGSVDEDMLPQAEEQYVRGDEWHVNYPQGEGAFALRFAFRPIETTSSRLVIETRLSIQTDLLDTHPKVDIDANCDDIDSLLPTDLSGEDQVLATGSAPISIAKGPQHTISVLLGPHDSPFTSNHSTDSLLRLRLFGEFLEKGVIRKARPWIVIDRSGVVPREAELLGRWKQLSGSPLPLTP